MPEILGSRPEEPSPRDPVTDSISSISEAVSKPTAANPTGAASTLVESTVVLDADEISFALSRMAHQIVEENRGTAGVCLVGIATRGEYLACRLAELISTIGDSPVPCGVLDVTMYRDDLRNQPTRVAHRTRLPMDINQASVVLVDDVLNSGRTIAAALEALKDYGRPRRVLLTVLIDRGHRELPIQADQVGKIIPTSTKEQVKVRLTEIDGDDAVVIVKTNPSES